MTRLAQTLGLTEFQTEIITTVRQFVDKEVIPTAQELEHSDTYPQAIVNAMKEMGLLAVARIGRKGSGGGRTDELAKKLAAGARLTAGRRDQRGIGAATWLNVNRA